MYSSGYSGGRSHVSTAMWYVPKSAREKEAFDQARLEIKNFLVVNKEGVNTTRIINFLEDVGVVIPYEKLGLTFNEFLFHCQDFIQVRMFLPHIYMSKSKFIFLNASAVDAETRHILTMVQEQTADKKKKSGQPRATVRNTYVVQAGVLLDSPPPYVRIGPPTLPAPRARGGPLRPLPAYFQRPIRAPIRVARPRLPSPFVPRAFSNAGRGGPAPAAMAAFSPSVHSAFVGFGAVPRAQFQRQAAFTEMMRPSPLSVLPPSNVVRCRGVIDQIDNREPPRSAILTPRLAPANCFPISSASNGNSQTPAPTPTNREPPVIQHPPQTNTQKAPTPTQPCSTFEVPEGFIHPLKACPTETCLSLLKKRMTDESFGILESCLSLTVTGFKEGQPGLFYVKLKKAVDGLIRIENMMKVFYEFKPERHPRVTKHDVILHGIYAGLDRDLGKAWRRVQVVDIRDDVDGDKPLRVFQIDHGKFLDLGFDDIRYLKTYSAGVMRHAYVASFAYLPNDSIMKRDAAHFFMRKATGQSFLCYVRNMETFEEKDGPRLMLRFAINLAMVGTERAKIHPIGVVY